MKLSKRVLLVTSAAPSQTPFSTWEKKPPLGVGFLLSMLRQAGHDVFFIDNYLEPSDFLETGYLQENGIDYVGIYVSTVCFRDTQRMLHKIEHLRRSGQWHGKIVVGGPHTTVALATIPAFVDHVVQGEGEQALVDIVEGKVRDRVVRYTRIGDLDVLPMPAWDLFTKLPYNWETLWFSETPTFTMTTSRGCPFRCAFCSVGAVWGKQYTCFSAARIVSDIEHLVEQYGAKGIYFREDNFTLDRKRVVDFCRLLLERHIDIRWVCESRVDSLDRELLELMHKAGARGFYFGVESGSQRILKELHKGITVDQIRTSFRLCHEIGFKTAASIVVGLPQETDEDLAATDALLSEIKPTLTWHNVFVGIPSSKLYQHVIDRKLYEFIDDRGLVYLKGHNDRALKYYQNGWDADIPFRPESPYVSVIMPAHNAAPYIAAAIQSILKQTFQNFELIVVNDGSTDDTKAILRQFQDPRITVIDNPSTLGQPKSRNNALDSAKGKYIAVMDADDISIPHRLETQIRFLESNPDYALVGSYAYQIDESDQYQSIIEPQTEDSVIRKCLHDGNNFVHGSVMVRSNVLHEIGGYDERFNYAADYDLWLRIIDAYKVGNLPEPLYCWRSSSTQISTAKKAEQDAFAKMAQREALERAAADRMLSDRICSEAQTLAMEGRLYEAVEILNRRVERKPNDSLAHFCLGQLHERRGDGMLAKACYEKAFSLEPTNTRFLKHLEDFLRNEEVNTRKALAIFDRVLNPAPRDSETFLSQGNMSASSPYYGDAEQFYKKVLDIDPGNVNAIEDLKTLPQMGQGDMNRLHRGASTQIAGSCTVEGQPNNWGNAPRNTGGTALVSVIVPTYNRPDMLGETLQSILQQTYPNIEIIVVNDAGKCVEALITDLGAGERIRYLRHERNMGLAAARNTGIRNSRGSYIAYLDDDDIFYPDHIETLVRFLETSECFVAYTDAYRAHQRVTATNQYEITHRDLPYSFDFDQNRFLFENYIPVLCLMHRKECLDSVGLFDETLKRTEDWDLLIRMSRQYSFAHIPTVTAEFRWRNDGSSMMTSAREPFAWAALHMFHKYKDYVAGNENALSHHRWIVQGSLYILQQTIIDGLRNNEIDIYKRFCAGTIAEIIEDLETLQPKYPEHQDSIRSLMSLLNTSLNAKGICAPLGDVRNPASELRNAINAHPFQFATLYVDTGKGFNEGESLKRLLPSTLHKEPITLDFDVGHFSDIRALRFDPIENVPAGIEVLCVTLTNRDGGSVEVAIAGSNAIEARENSFIFTTRDPALYLSLPEQAVDIKSIGLVVKYSAGQEYVGLLERTVEALKQHASSSSLHAKLYIDRGEGFSESSALVLPLPLDSDSGSVSLTFPLRGADPIRALRFDPVENAAAIVEISRIELHAGSLVKPVRIRESNAECILHNRYAFTTDDPSLHLDVPRGMEHAESLVLEAAYSVRGAYVNAIGGIVSACAAGNCLKDPAGRRYFAKLSVDSGSGFTEGDALLFELPCDPKTGLIGLDIDLTPYRKIKALRWDPIEHAAPVVELNQLQVYRKGKPIRASVSGTNAKSVCDNILIFASDDPYLEITLPTDAPAADRLHIEYRVLVRNN